MRFGFCLFKYFPYGGLQRDFLKVAREALARGHQVVVWTMSWEGPIEPGIELHLLPAKGCSNHQRAGSFAQQWQQAKQQHPCDVYLGFNRLGGLDFYFAADPCFAAQFSSKASWRRWLPRYRHYVALEQALYREATQIFLLDPQQQAVIQAHYPVKAARFHQLSPSVTKPTGLLSQAEARRKVGLNVPVSTYGLLAVGVDQQRKGLDRTLLAIAALPETVKAQVQLWVVGQNGHKTFQAQAKALGVAMHWLGARDDVYELMQAADLLLHPAYQETAGMVLVEALVNALPVIVSDNCGYAFHVQQAQAGIVLPGGAAFQQARYNDALAAALTMVREGVWQDNARRYVQQHDLFSMPQQVIDALEHFVPNDDHRVPKG